MWFGTLYRAIRKDIMIRSFSDMFQQIDEATEQNWEDSFAEYKHNKRKELEKEKRCGVNLTPFEKLSMGLLNTTKKKTKGLLK